MEPQEQATRYHDVAAAAAVAAASAAVTATAGIMKELGEIKVTQAINAAEIKNIGKEVTEIKGDVKEIKALYVTHVELKDFKDSINSVDADHEKRIRFNESVIRYGMGGLAVIQVVIGIYLALR